MQPLQHHTNQAAIIALFRVVNRYLGNLAPMPGVFPDYPAPVVRNSGGELEMTMMRWGIRCLPARNSPTSHDVRGRGSFCRAGRICLRHTLKRYSARTKGNPPCSL